MKNSNWNSRETQSGGKRELYLEPEGSALAWWTRLRGKRDEPELVGRQEEFKLESEGNVKWRELRIVSCWQVPVRQHDEESWNCRGTRSVSREGSGTPAWWRTRIWREMRSGNCDVSRTGTCAPTLSNRIWIGGKRELYLVEDQWRWMMKNSNWNPRGTQSAK